MTTQKQTRSQNIPTNIIIFGSFHLPTKNANVYAQGGPLYQLQV